MAARFSSCVRDNRATPQSQREDNTLLPMEFFEAPWEERY